MPGMNIRKLLKQKRFLRVIQEAERISGAFMTIKDNESVLVYGGDIQESVNQCYPIEINGEIFCWIMGKEKIINIVPMLSYIISCEYEKRSVSDDALEKYKEINLLYNFSEKISSCLDLKEVCSITLEEAKKIIKCTSGTVILKNDDNGEFEAIIMYKSDENLKSLNRVSLGIEKNIILKGAGEIINDAISDSRFDGDPGNTKVIICSPFKVKNKVIGAISLSHNSHIMYEAKDLKLLNALSSQAAAAIENAKMFEDVRDSLTETLNTLMEAVEMIDQGKHGHCSRVMKYSLMIGEELKISKKELSLLKFSALLHDIGKIGIKPSQMEKHPVLGAQLLRHVKRLKDALPAIQHHHEKFNGTGYPDSLKGSKIPIGARIIAVANEFDHSFTDSFGNFQITSKDMKSLMENTLDPEITEKFLNLYAKCIKSVSEKLDGTK